ncbi:hypothetical protein M5K25_021922 [Dendrobium thyrsiflorum]|uniref:Uncharacterized protein n=1 Tax=Dendrobium thyrsiflorum TaxID=117978 RepID=A0ABD0UAZ9_DENTH
MDLYILAYEHIKFKVHSLPTRRYLFLKSSLNNKETFLLYVVAIKQQSALEASFGIIFYHYFSVHNILLSSNCLNLKKLDKTKVVEAKELSVDTDEPTDVSNHHSLPRQSFGDGGNDQNQLGSNNEESNNGTNIEKKN